jgi:hypothetical protein
MLPEQKKKKMDSKTSDYVFISYVINSVAYVVGLDM